MLAVRNWQPMRSLQTVGRGESLPKSVGTQKACEDCDHICFINFKSINNVRELAKMEIDWNRLMLYFFMK